MFFCYVFICVLCECFRVKGRCCRSIIFTQLDKHTRKIRHYEREKLVRCVESNCCCFLLHSCSFTLDAGLLARSQYPEGPATGHLDTGFSWFPCVYKQILRRFPTFQVATTCFSCSPPDLNSVVTNFIFCIHVK